MSEPGIVQSGARLEFVIAFEFGLLYLTKNGFAEAPMKPSAYLICILLNGICVWTLAAPLRAEVVLGTNVTSAYAAQYTARIRGGSLEHMECIFSRLQLPHKIIYMPWRRAYQEVRTRRIDGFFTTILLNEEETGGIYSEPLVLENWYWFWRSDTPEPDSWKSNYKLGVILGSPQAVWMQHNQYSTPIGVNNLPQLLKLLFRKRIDVVLADKEHFEKAAADLQISSDSYHFRFLRYVSLGAFFGDPLVQEQPLFLKDFNRHIYPCAPEGFQVSEYERQKIKQLMLPKMHKWIAFTEIIKPIASQNIDNREKSLEQLLLKDAQWQEEFSSATPDFSATVLANPLSEKLRQLKEESAGLITEIIVMDERGFNAGISDMTSDYWQGDEEKYLQIFNRPADTLFFDAVLFDESTRRFQVQISAQIYQAENPQAIGVMTVAVDIEKILSLSE